MITPEWFEQNGGPGQYDQHPTNDLPKGYVVLGEDQFWTDLTKDAQERASKADETPLVLLDTYPGTDLEALTALTAKALRNWNIVNVETAAKSVSDLDQMLEPFLTDDPVFGRMNDLTVSDFYDATKLEDLGQKLQNVDVPTIAIGWGAALLGKEIPWATLVLVDIPRWEIQKRQRTGATNWHADNAEDGNLLKYKRGFFVEWRAGDAHKANLFSQWDFVVDGGQIGDAGKETHEAGFTAITGDAFRAGMESLTTHPFRVVPFFDPGVWGGEWMETLVNLEPQDKNYAWCFDCVPEENSLLFTDGERKIELAAMDLTLSQPVGLLGEGVYERFGAEFPIRFDLLDTMGGGNLSLQVHPLKEYIKEQFGMAYTQDESYYMLDALPDASVYLGLRENVDPEEMVDALRVAEAGDAPFDTERYVNKYPVKKHDHFSIPSGTVHCSGVNSMVLEISATPYIFTFKLWDWDRLGLDGKPRPVHIDHGAKNIQWDRDTAWVQENLLDQVEVLEEDGGNIEERVGLHELEFIELRRDWFDSPVDHSTEGTVNVLNLVEGDQVQVVSPTGAFDPMVIHYAETFIVPAAVGPYRIEPGPQSKSKRFGTVKAYVRGTTRG